MILVFLYLVYLLTSCLSDPEPIPSVLYRNNTPLHCGAEPPAPWNSPHFRQQMETSPIPVLKGQWTELVKLFLWCLMTVNASGKDRRPERGKGINYSAQQCGQHM